MDTNQINVALIGCSGIAKKHAAALDRMEHARLVAVCDLDAERRDAMASEYNVPSYHDYHEMLERQDLDVVSVLTPSGSHAAVAADIARTGRHVIVEKPMALTVEDAQLQVDVCKANNVRLFVVMQNRFSRPVVRMKQALDDGRFGRLVMGTVRLRWTRHQAYYDAADWRGTWERDGGVFCNQACHHIDLLQWTLGDVESVMAMKATRLVDIESEDTGVAILRFTSGALGIIEATTAWRPRDREGSFSICGENGSVEIGGFIVNDLKHWEFDHPVAEDKTVFDDHGANPDIFAWTHEQLLRDVSDALIHDRRALVEASDGKPTVELINAIYESAETGQEIFLRFRPKHSRLGRAASHGRA